MAQQSKHGGTFANDSTVGTVDWSNLSNAGTSDDNLATVDLDSNDISHYLKITNFGFSIPDTATINWVKVSIEKSASDPGAKDYSIKLVKGGNISGDDKATSTDWPDYDEYKDYGGSDTWELTLTADDINASNFGVAISVKSYNTNYVLGAAIDDVIITVDYTLSLTIADLTHSHSFNNIDLIQNILLVLQDLTHSHQIDNVTLLIAGLVIQNLTHSSLIDNIDLTQVHNLTLQDLTHSNLIDSINLITGITLVLSDLIHSGVIDSVNLTQVHNLVVQNTTHQNQIENTILEVMLYIQNATHNGVINNVVLTQIHNLIVNNLSHLNKMDNLDLIQQHILAIQDICHYLKIDTTKLLAWLLKVEGGIWNKLADNGDAWNQQVDEGSNWKKRN